MDDLKWGDARKTSTAIDFNLPGNRGWNDVKVHIFEFVRCIADNDDS